MTVIAWDGKTLAADKQSTVCGIAVQTTKVHVVPEGIVAFYGATSGAVAMLEWFNRARDICHWPEKIQQNDETNAYSVFVDWSGKVWLYENFPYAIPKEGAFFAGGSGRDMALAALDLGFTAVEAVECANRHCITCGMGVDSLNLAEEYAKHLEQQMKAVRK
jgi:hypothetical protein